MNFFPLPKGTPVLVIDDMYSELELLQIWKELEFLTTPARLGSPHETGAAADDNGEVIKSGKGVFLDEFYANRKYSDILSINRKIFSQQVTEYAVENNIFFTLLRNINLDHTLINYYDTSQEYRAHCDSSVFTAITVFYREPIQFAGGDLEFPELGLTIEKRNNRTILFPGTLRHAVTTVQMQVTHDPYSGYGRYSMAQFLNVS
jgi:hypothetical protein